MKTKIAIVEDMNRYLENLRSFLASEGYEVLAIQVADQSAENIAEEVKTFAPHLLLLDDTLRNRYPSLSGGDVALRLHSEVPFENRISISGRGEMSYCKWHFGFKENIEGNTSAQKELLELVVHAKESTRWITIRSDLHVRLERCNFGGGMGWAVGGFQREGIVVEAFTDRHSKTPLWDTDYTSSRRASFAGTDLTPNEEEIIHKTAREFSPHFPLWKESGLVDASR